MRRTALFLLVLLTIIPGLVWADVFTPHAGDKSVEFLGKILGNRVGALYLGGTPSPILLSMFEKFNAAIVCIGTIIVSYVGLVSTINTAQEGKTMGRKFASIWIPLRAVLGMAVLVPTPASGYSVVQVLVMWIILHGVGAADHIWNGILGDLSSGLSPMRQLEFDEANPVQQVLKQEIRAQAVELSEAVLNSATCVTAFRTFSNKPELVISPPTSPGVVAGKKIKLYDNKPTVSIQPNEVNLNGTIYVGVPGDEKFADVCGRYNISATVNRGEWDNQDKITDRELLKQARNIYQTKVMALKAMFDTSIKLARDIVDQDTKPRDANNRLAAIPEVPVQPIGYRNQLINIYTTEMSRLVRPEEIEATQDIVRQGQQSGWIAAGSYYFSFNKIRRLQFFDDITKPPQPQNVPMCTLESHCVGSLPAGSKQLNADIREHLKYPDEKNFIATRLWDANVYISKDRGTAVDQLDLGAQDIPIAAPDGQEDDDRLNMRRDMNQVQKDLLGNLVNLMNGTHSTLGLPENTDPLIAQAAFGGLIMWETEKAIYQSLEAEDYIRRLEAERIEILPEHRDTFTKIMQRGQFLLSIYGVLWVIGATLAIYVPLVPYMMFAVGVVGWFLLVIEAVVAAPILALSFILPSGEELGKIMQGAMILLNIVLRPSLMLFGFILAARLYGVVIEFINFGLVSNISNLDSGGSMFAWAGILALYGAFIVTLANKCFALIYGLPDKILRWMGGAPEHTDASQDLYQTKGGMSKGTDAINKLSQGYAERSLNQARVRGNQTLPPPTPISKEEAEDDNN